MQRYKMRNQILIAVLICLNSIVSITECSLSLLCKDIENNSTELRLMNHLFCDYDNEVRPHTKDNEATKVWVTLLPKLIEFDDQTDTLSVHCWTHLNWSDPFLKWNPEDFDGISDLTVPHNDVWIPDLTVHNSGTSDEDELGIPKTNCMITNDGAIMCIPTVKYVSHCNSDYANYPYDTLNCTIELASSGYHSDELSIVALPIGVMMPDFTTNQDWKVWDFDVATELRDYKMNFKNESYTSHVYTLLLILQRQNTMLHTLYVGPAYALTVLTLCVLWLECRSKERTILACICFITHLLSMQHLYYFIPHNGGVMPYIMQFYENSFLIITFVLILTVLLRELQDLTTEAPGWVKSGTSLVLQSRVGQLLLLSILDPKASAFMENTADDNDDLMRVEKKDSGWKYVSLLVGWLAFISIFFIYVLLMTLYLPAPCRKLDSLELQL